MDNFRRFLGDDDPVMADVDAGMMEGFFRWRLEQRDPRLKIAIKPHCVVGELELFSGVFKAAMVRNLIPFNPLASLLKMLRNRGLRLATPAGPTKWRGRTRRWRLAGPITPGPSRNSSCAGLTWPCTVECGATPRGAWERGEMISRHSSYGETWWRSAQESSGIRSNFQIAP